MSSPFARAQESVRPLAKERGISVQLDERLAERVLSAEPMPDWLEKLRRTFVELDLCFPGGESSRAAIRRAVSAVEDVLRENVATSVIVTHGAL
ncbi:histidine phosphatase family protein, partial [Frankia sp. Cpl3]|nr:histidine phosphatase family protein [Frankia sp. Cpl3]